MLAASPKGTVPVLCLPSGEVLHESLHIMHWALRHNDPLGWLPSSPQAQALVDGMIALNDGEFKAHLDRYKYPQRFGLESGLPHRTLGAEVLMQWELVLQENVQTHGQVHAYLSGPQWGLLDACVAPFVRQFARTDRVWFDAQPWPQLSQWLMAFENSETFAEVMGKHPLWVALEA
jgi:glutathione S-transferase